MQAQPTKTRLKHLRSSVRDVSGGGGPLGPRFPGVTKGAPKKEREKKKREKEKTEAEERKEGAKKGKR